MRTLILILVISGSLGLTYLGAAPENQLRAFQDINSKAVENYNWTIAQEIKQGKITRTATPTPVPAKPTPIPTATPDLSKPTATFSPTPVK